MCYAGCDFLLTMRAAAPQTESVPRNRAWVLFFALLAFNFLLRIVYARFGFLRSPVELWWAVSASEFLAGNPLYPVVWMEWYPGASSPHAAFFAQTGVKM